MLTKKWLFVCIIMFIVMLTLSFSGCSEEKTESENIPGIPENNETPTLQLKSSYGAASGENIITPADIRIKDWKIIVDRIQITLENTGDSDIFVDRICADISFDEDMSTFKHYEATLNSELGPQESKVITIKIHQLNEWEKPYLKTIEVI